MYSYIIKGEDEIEGKVKKIGKAIAVLVDKEWIGERVIVIKDSELRAKNMEAETPEREAEVNDCRINQFDGRPEICMQIIETPEGREEDWTYFEVTLLREKMGKCPDCGRVYNLLRFDNEASVMKAELEDENKEGEQ